MNQELSSPTVWHIGGEDTHLRIPLLLLLREKGFNIGAIGSGDGSAFIDRQIPYFQYNLERGINPLTDMHTCNQLFNLFIKYKPDIVHGFDTKPAIAVPLVAKKAGIPGRVCTITGMGYIFSSNSPLALALRPVYRYLQRQGSAAAGVTVFQNTDDREYFHQHSIVPAGRDELVLSSGIDVEQLQKNSPNPQEMANLKQELGLEDKLVVTMVARLVASKGVREFLQAASQVHQQIENVAFLLIGPSASEGNQAVSPEEIHQYSGVVRYLGPRKDIPALLAVSDLFVLPSYYREGVPRVLLEAGAMKLPLITTNMPGCKDVVRPDWNGLLVPPKDAEALAKAILQLLSSPEQRKIMGDRSQLHVQEKFSLQHVADQYADIYYRVLQQPSLAMAT